MGSERSAMGRGMSVERSWKGKVEKHTGKRIWHPDAAARGKITPQLLPVTLQPIGTSGRLKMTIPAIKTHATVRENQYFFRILGTSLKKLLFCTSLTVAPQVMLYENIWARIEMVIGSARPPKKKKKNGIHLTFSRRPQRNSLYPSRYSRRVNPIVPDPKKTTAVASQISKLCM